MITAIVLAAGQSKRMGQPKLILPWGSSTVIRQVVNTLIQAELDEILLVTGGAHQDVQAALSDLPVHFLYNPIYAQSEMLVSLQLGLSILAECVEAALIVLGDQPQIQVEVVQAVIAAYHLSKPDLVVPSFHMHRGHPWLVARAVWLPIRNLSPQDTLRNFLNSYHQRIHYLEVNTASILQDLDTPKEYRHYSGK